MKMNTDPKKIEELLDRGVENLIPTREKLAERLASGDVLRIKFGIDPTSPHMHLGHTVPLRKLRQFQDLGHQAVLIIGDATAMIGDPTGRSETRNRITKEDVKKNQKTYLKQAGKVLDLKRLEVHHNGEWFNKMSMKDTLELTSLVTVQQVLQREDFRKRVDDPENPLSVLEILYPVMQGYDSVMIKADIEIGGTDQLLNLHMGRRLQRRYKMSEQGILTVPLIEGTDGVRKMSKSFGNAIALQDEPEDMYGKLMSIPDAMIGKYFQLLSDLPIEEIEAVMAQMNAGGNPRDAKARLAWELTRLYHGAKAADAAREAFASLFSKGEEPEDMMILEKNGIATVIDLLVESKLAASRGDARRLIDGGGIKLAGKVIKSDESVEPTKEGVVIQKGKRHFVRVVKKL